MKLECDAYKFSTFSYLPFKLRFQTKKKVTQGCPATATHLILF